MKRVDVAVIGAGFGGLAAAVELSAAGLSVAVFEAGPRPGGKGDEVLVDGIACDTGPTLLTLPDIAKGVFERAHRSLEDYVTLVRLDPAFRYLYPDGAVVDVHHELPDTLTSVGAALGSRAAEELERHLERARTIWEASADTFVFGAAPGPRQVLSLGPRAWFSLSRIDAHRSLWDVICADVQDERLRWLLARYATYNGSDVRKAPGTLACIAWVELGLGAWGVEGGMHALAKGLEAVAREHGAVFSYNDPVERIDLDRRGVTGLRTRSGTCIQAGRIVCNADAAHLAQTLLPRERRGALGRANPPSTSGWVGIIKARHRDDRVPHEVVFPKRYLAEFEDLFDHERTPVDPAVYTCALSRAHGRARWDEHEPLFVMVNAPAIGSSPDDAPWAQRVHQRLVDAGRIHPEDLVAWERTPRMLETRFPDTRGAIYGASSNSPLAAFRRPPNTLPAIPGLHLAGGSAHPGGGVPLCLQSGHRAASEAMAALGMRALR